MKKLRFAIFLCWGGILAFPQNGESFTRSQDPQTGACLWWRHRSINYLLNEKCSDDVLIDHCIWAVKEAHNAWNNYPCSDINLVYTGTTNRTDVGFDETNWSNNINLVIFLESRWPHEHSAIGINTVTYDVETGEIVDGDVELNGLDYTFSTKESGESMMDIHNTLSHESGHLLGLDHSKNRDATMFATAVQGETKKRDLSQDDIAGLCYVYQSGKQPPECHPRDDTCGCSSKTKNPAIEPALMFLFALLIIYMIPNRLRRRKY